MARSSTGTILLSRVQRRARLNPRGPRVPKCLITTALRCLWADSSQPQGGGDVVLEQLGVYCPVWVLAVVCPWTRNGVWSSAEKLHAYAPLAASAISCGVRRRENEAIVQRSKTATCRSRNKAE